MEPESETATGSPAESLKPAQVSDFSAVSEPRWSPSGSRLGWLAEFEGSTRFFFLNETNIGVEAPSNLDSSVRRTPPTYGGTWAWCGDTSVVVVGSDARVLLLDLDSGSNRVLIDDDASRYLSPAVSTDGRWLAVSRERSDAMEIVLLDIDARLNLVSPIVISNADFAWDPVWSPDGALLAWHEWSNPDMPWDSSRIVVADFDEGVTSAPRVVAGGIDEQVGQPRFSPDGARLAWVSDSDGWLRVCVGNLDGSNAAFVTDEAFESGEAPWARGNAVTRGALIANASHGAATSMDSVAL